MATMTKMPRPTNWWIWGGAAAAAVVAIAALAWSLGLFGGDAETVDPAPAPAADVTE